MRNVKIDKDLTFRVLSIYIALNMMVIYPTHAGDYILLWVFLHTLYILSFVKLVIPVTYTSGSMFTFIIHT